jgi:FHS family L-fucose permease-like MFS transporter
MALPLNDDQPTLKNSESTSYTIPFILVTSLFFLWGLANSLNGSLVKQFQTALDLQRWQANIVETAFYFGYFAMALPAGYVMKKMGYKAGILMGLILYAAGSFLFYPAAEVRMYSFFLAALFLIAAGIAFLETAANLYVTVLGDPEKGDFRLNLAQSFNGMSIILGPIIGGLFIFSEKEYTREMIQALPAAEAEAIRVSQAASVQMPYVIIGIVVALVAILFVFTKMPELQSAEESTEKTTIASLLKRKHLVLGILAQFLNVGAQVSLWGNFVDLKLDLAKDDNLWIVDKIYQISDTMSPTQIASFHASFAFILYLLVRFLVTYLIAVYFFQSIMFPTIFALSCKGLGDGSKLASSLIIMSIVGGAIVPPLTAALFKISTAAALGIPLLCFAYIIYFAFKGFEIKD